MTVPFSVSERIAPIGPLTTTRPSSARRSNAPPRCRMVCIGDISMPMSGAMVREANL